MQRVRRDHEPQWLLLPLLELRVDERVLVIWNLEFGICDTMTGTVVHEHEVRSGIQPAGRTLPGLPSLSSLACLLPLVLLYWQVGGPSALLTDPNTGVHVRAGEWILSHHAMPRQDLFSFTLAGRAWCDWEWLSDVLDALLFQVPGLSAIVAFHLALLCLISVILYRTARLRVGPTMAFAVTCLVMATTTIHWLARPHLLTWLFLAVFCFLLERADVTGEYRPLLALPVLIILWVNLHPGFVVGLLVLAAWSVSALLRWRLASNSEDRFRRRNQALWFCLTLAACLAATCVNPYFWRLDGHIASYLFSSSSVTSHVAEWLSPDFRNPRLHWFELLLPLAAAAALWEGLRRHLAHCTIVLGLMHLALGSVRNVPMFAIVAVGPLAATTGPLLTRWSFGVELGAGEQALGLRRSRALTVASCVVGFAVLLGVLWRGPVGFGRASSLPIDAARHLPAGRLFTTDQWADYLIYIQPDRKVFFDCRNDAYGAEAVEDYVTVMTAAPGWGSVLDKYSLNVALVPKTSPITAALLLSRDWKLFYQDSVAAVFTRSME
jgi:hypothetical protein